MSKMRKLLAILLTFAMVLGMSITTFAAGSATITVNKAEPGAKFSKTLIVQADPTTETGWDIVDDYADEFTSAFGNIGEQEIIKGMINAVDSKKGVAITDFNSKYAAALNAIWKAVATDELTSPITVDEAGIYLIKGADSEEWIYSPMAAYVAFGPYDTTTGVPTDLVNTTVEAKKAPKTLTKDATSVENFNEITEIGRTETYKVEGVVPYIPLTDSNRHYWAKDNISGAAYVLENGKVKVTVKVGDAAEETMYATLDADGKGFALDLSDLLANNTHANKAIVLKYQAKVTDVRVHNDVKLGDGSNDGRFGKASEDLYTGEIELTKYAEDDTKDVLTDNAKLAGAKFVVYKDVNGTKSYAKFDANNKFAGWVAAEEDATKIVTATGGKVKVEGLDEGTYYFKEVEAPEGYSVNKTDVSATLVLTDGKTVADAILAADTYMMDTKLVELPGTGGIGTTIFTVAGCGIMIAAAYLFFASRRKEEA